MSQLWIQREAQWCPVLLEDEAYAFERQVGLAENPLRRRPAGDASRSEVELFRSEELGADSWTLLSVSGEVRINGLPLAGGLRVLRDRDEIRVGGGRRYYFSTERPATVEPYPRQDGSGCPRCQMPIERETPAVRCPGCDVWYHQSREYERGCYTYGPDCVVCRRATALDGAFDWTPDDV